MTADEVRSIKQWLDSAWTAAQLPPIPWRARFKSLSQLCDLALRWRRCPGCEYSWAIDGDLPDGEDRCPVCTLIESHVEDETRLKNQLEEERAKAAQARADASEWRDALEFSREENESLRVALRKREAEHGLDA
jgi:hypothetical protein